MSSLSAAINTYQNAQAELIEHANQVARTMRSRMYTLIKDGHEEVTTVNVTQEGNFTLVTLNGTFTGVAKFNPNDVKKFNHVNKKGNKVSYIKSKYSSSAGVNRALHRALCKMLGF